MAIPIALQGTDMVGQARTGTGKTLAFGISTLQRISVPGEADYDELEFPGKPQALIMAPTRELAIQVAKDMETASSVRKARVLTVYGGVSYDSQLEALASGVDVVVGTPGRLLDLVQRGSLNLRHVKVVVLDEADEMLDLGFLPDVERLLSQTPLSRQTLLFSATMPSAIMSLARNHLSHPVNIRAEAHDANVTVPDTTQFVYQAHDLDKPEMIARIFQSPDFSKGMVFTKTKRAAQRLSDDLEARGFKVASLHGDLNQTARERALKRFRRDDIDILVSTDVAARGIDVTGVSHVINNECPDDDKAYVHRIGRTGRAGAKGVAVTLVDWSDIVRWKTINKVLDLPFPDPVETYSTSAHLYADLAIPEGTKGRLPGAAPQKEAAPSKNRSRSQSKEEGRERPREARQPSTRTRRRLRNGEPVTKEVPETSVSVENPAEKPAKPRRRRGGRNRSKGEAAPEQTS
ncbi:MAG: DEAD/DEAH box helicase [Propionibacteriaceae bacterium]